MCGFNYRFAPAVRMARELIDAGELGEIRHFRGHYLQDWGDDPKLDSWRFRSEDAGSGALGDLAAHVIDLARFLVGEIEAVSAVTKTFIPDRQVDDAVEVLVSFSCGAVGTIEATRLGLGHRNGLEWEINGSKASLRFDLERLNELELYRGSQRGFATVKVSDPDMPFWSWWWPPGHMLGWEHTFVHEIYHLLDAIANGADVAPPRSDV
jgi:predicted dehydrogenase